MTPHLVTAGEGFRAAFGHSPEGVWCAPGRVNLIGEFTDYNGGFVLPFALELGAQAGVARRGDGLIRVASAQRPESGVIETSLGDLAPQSASHWSSYVLGVLWAMKQALPAIEGADVYLDSAVPIGSGLSSSAAIECAVGLAVADLSGAAITRPGLASLARRAENEFVGVPSGIMDQTASLCCEAGHVLLLDTRTLAQRQVPFEPTRNGLTLLVVDTMVRHALRSSAYAERRRDCFDAAATLGVPALCDVAGDAIPEALARLTDETLRRRARHVLTENQRVLEVVDLLEAGQAAGIGPVLTAGHRSLQYDFEVSSPELDVAVDAALDAGALGARMTGGGFGGSAVVLLAESSLRTVTESIVAAFSARGFQAPELRTVAPSAGASRVA